MEGLTEFLPISSTAHLRLTEALLGVNLEDGYWKMFTIVIQLGPILCLPIYFWKRITAFFDIRPFGPRHPVVLTLIAFVVTSATSLPLKKIVDKHLESFIVMGLAFIIGGIVMWLVDLKYGAGASEDHAAAELERMSVGQSVWIGLCQTLAPVFPGTSRSMATIAAGQVSGLSRTAALEFSFLLSIPTMAAATGYDLLKFMKEPAESGAPANGLILVAIGMVISFVVAYAVIAWFMNWVKSRGFTPFAIYRILLGAVVLVWAFK